MSGQHDAVDAAIDHSPRVVEGLDAFHDEGPDIADVAQDRGVKLDVAKGLSCAAQGDLVLGRAVGVIKSRPRRSPLGDSPQIMDGLGVVESPLDTVEPGLPEPDQRREVTHLRHPPLDAMKGRGLRSS